MPKNDAAAQISFHGLDTEQILLDNPDVRRFVQSEAMNIPHALIKCFVSPRTADEALQWSVSVASPRGRQSFLVVQRVALGAIFVTAE